MFRSFDRPSPSSYLSCCMRNQMFKLARRSRLRLLDAAANSSLVCFLYRLMKFNVKHLMIAGVALATMVGGGSASETKVSCSVCARVLLMMSPSTVHVSTERWRSIHHRLMIELPLFPAPSHITRHASLVPFDITSLTQTVDYYFCPVSSVSRLSSSLCDLSLSYRV